MPDLNFILHPVLNYNSGSIVTSFDPANFSADSSIDVAVASAGQDIGWLENCLLPGSAQIQNAATEWIPDKPIVPILADFFIASPNPFNPSTSISFELPAASHVSLKVYDVCGCLVTTLADDWREAGSHQVTWDASGLPSGLYFCRMQAGVFSATQKMILIK